MDSRIRNITDTLAVATFGLFGLGSLLLFIMLFAGCAGLTPDRCAQSAAIYAAYVDAFERGEVIDQDDIQQARLAGELLVISCGWAAVWQPEETRRSPSWKILTKEGGQTVTVPLDRNLVPVIAP